MSYFVEGLNYSLSNEDTRVEYDLLKENAGEVFCIGGSGARVLPLIARSPQSLQVVDISPLQLHLVELRVQAARALTYDEFLFLLGYRGGMSGGKVTGDSRYDLFLALKLTQETFDFWEKQKENWLPQGFIYLGRWERHFLKISKIFHAIVRMPVEKLFEAQTLEDQIEAYKKHFKPKVFRTFLRIVASEYVFNKFLYKGHFSGREGQKSDPRAPWQMIDEEFTRILTTQLVRKNYFFQMLFLGRIQYEEGLPLEADRELFKKIKESKTQVNYQAANLLEGLKDHTWDFVSLSDTISYLSNVEMNLLYSRLTENTNVGAISVIRSFLRAPSVGQVPGWMRLADAEQKAVQMDGTGVYQFQILKKT